MTIDAEAVLEVVAVTMSPDGVVELDVERWIDALLVTLDFSLDFEDVVEDFSLSSVAFCSLDGEALLDGDGDVDREFAAVVSAAVTDGLVGPSRL